MPVTRVVTVAGIGESDKSFLDSIQQSSQTEFRYDIDDLKNKAVSHSLFFKDTAVRLLDQVSGAIDDDYNGPIVFFAWDFGGSIVKEAMIVAFNNPKYHKLASLITTLTFFGTPHQQTASASWEAISLGIICTLRQDAGQWHPSCIGKLSAYHRNLHVRFQQISHRYKIIQYCQSPSDGSAGESIHPHTQIISEDVAALMSEREEHVVRNVPLNELSTLPEGPNRDALTSWLIENSILLKDTYQSFMRALIRESKSSDHESLPCPTFPHTVKACLENAVPRSWLSLDSSTPVILRLPSLLSSKLFTESIGSYVRSLKEGDLRRYNVIYSTLESTHCSLDFTIRCLSSLIHQLLVHRPSYWEEIQDIFPTNDVLDAIQTNRSFSELVLWRCFESILSAKTWNSIIFVFHLSKTVSIDESGRGFLCRLLNMTKFIDTDFQVILVMETGSQLDIDTSASLLHIDGDQPSLQEALRRDINNYTKSFQSEDTNFEDIASIQKVWENIPNDVAFLLAYGRYSTIRSWSLKPATWGNDLSTNDGAQLIIREMFRAIPEIDQELLIEILSIILYAQRLMQLEELEAILRVVASRNSLSSPSMAPSQAITTYLTPLVYLRGKVIHFINENAKDGLRQFLDGISIKGFRAWGCEDESIHSRIAGACLSYTVCAVNSEHAGTAGGVHEQDQENHDSQIKDVGFPDIANLFSQWPFLGYAVEHWPRHYKIALDEGAAALITTTVSSFLSDHNACETWLRLWLAINYPRAATNRSSPLPSYLSPVEISANSNLPLWSAIEVSQKALSVLENLNWSYEIAVTWAIAEVKGVDQASFWPQTTPIEIERLRLLVKCLGRGPGSTLRLLSSADAEFVESNLQIVLSESLAVGEDSVLDYVKRLGIQIPAPILMSILRRQYENWSVIGYSSMIPKLIEYQPDLGRLLKEEPGWDILHMAVASADIGAVKALIHSDINFSVSDTSTRSPIFLAAQYGLIEVLNILLGQCKDTDIHFADNENRTALHAAALNGHLRCVCELVRAGAQSNVKDSFGETPFQIAVRKNHLKMVKFFLDYENSCLTNEEIPGQPKMESIIPNTVRNLDQTNELGIPPLVSCINNGQSGMAVMLIERGASLTYRNTKYPTVLHLASTKALDKVVEALLQVPVERQLDLEAKDIEGKTSLYIAAERGHTNVVSLLLDHKAYADVKDDSGLTALERTVIKGHASIAKMLLSKSKYSVTILGECLHRAAIGGLSEIAYMALESGADKNYQDDDGYTALQLAASYSKPDVVRILLLRRADLDLKNIRGKTALLYASEESCSETLRLLLDAGADIEVTDEMDRTPLVQAFESGHQSTILMLIKYGAKLQSPKLNEDKILDILEALPKEEVVEILHAQKRSLGSSGTTYMSGLLKRALNRQTSKDFVLTLLQNGADLEDESMHDKRFGGPFQLAVYDCRLEAVTALFEYADQTKKLHEIVGKFGTVLNLCVANDERPPSEQCRMFDYLISKGADPSLVGGTYGTPIHTAAAMSVSQVVKYIQGSNTSITLETRDQEGKLVSHVVACGSNEMLFPMVLAGKYLDEPDRQGRLPIHLAAGSGSLLALQYIAERYRDESRDISSLMNKKDIDGWTALHWACRQYDKDAVQLILSLGANRDERTDEEGWSAKDIAALHGNTLFFELFFNDQATPTKAWASSFAICDSCRCSIFGDRHRCQSCDDFDLCFKCFKYVHAIHYPGHVFVAS